MLSRDFTVGMFALYLVTGGGWRGREAKGTQLGFREGLDTGAWEVADCAWEGQWANFGL